jgi:hypothetical protein
VSVANGNDDDESHSKLTRYIMEGCRLSTVAPELARVPNKDVVIDDGDKQVPVKAGDTIFTGLVWIPLLDADNSVRQIIPRRCFPSQ